MFLPSILAQAVTCPRKRGNSRSLAWQPWKYLLPGVLRGQETPPSDSVTEFRTHRSAGEQQFLVVFIIFVIEVPLVHLVVHRFSSMAAWIITGLTLLMLLWIIGVFAAARQRLSWIGQHELHVNDGLFTEYQVQRSNIDSITLQPIGDSTQDVAGAPWKAVLSLVKPITVRSLAAPAQLVEVTVETGDSAALEIFEAWQGEYGDPTT